MTTSNALPTSKLLTPDYGIDAPSVLRNLFLFGVLCFVLALVLTRQYAAEFRRAGLLVQRRFGNPFATFPPLAVVVARKPS